MTTTAFLISRGRAWRSASLPVLLGCLWLAGPTVPARAQEFSGIDWGRSPVLPSDLNPAFLLAPGSAPGPINRAGRVPLLYFQPGFLSDPLGLSDPDDVATAQQPKALDFDEGGDWINITHGHDNPYFDIRRRGDPGGVGYYRVNTQVQLFDTKTTACAVALRAVAPAGLQYDGLQDRQGSTVLTPNFSIFHALDDGTAFQTFVGKHLPVEQYGTAPLTTNLTYGVAVQRPLTADANDALHNFYLSMGALGQNRSGEAPGPVVSWEVLPGFSWKVAENCMLSGALIVPVSAGSRDNAGRWQFTCSFQF